MSITDPEPLVLFVLVLWAIGSAGRRFSPKMRASLIVTTTMGVGVAALFAWMMLLTLGVVQVDPFLRSLGMYRLEPPWGALIFLGPPAIAALVFGVSAAWAARQRRP